MAKYVTCWFCLLHLILCYMLSRTAMEDSLASVIATVIKSSNIIWELMKHVWVTKHWACYAFISMQLWSWKQSNQMLDTGKSRGRWHKKNKGHTALWFLHLYWSVSQRSTCELLSPQGSWGRVIPMESKSHPWKWLQDKSWMWKLQRK